ncbi:DNA polymerase Y family protein [Streptomyces albogriseolus]|uniref:DNA polymerase Y family protein n=1 Tax=Streptomyces albogriseolus TaxID=1887 RepID=UPI003F49C45B
MHLRCPDRLPEEIYRQVLEQLAELSPVVQALPPSAALVELRGALRYHGTDAPHLGEVLRVRTISRLGVDIRVGVGPSITVAATASAQIAAPGGVLAIDPDQATAWLAGLPVDALHGIGPRQAQVLREYGMHSVGLLAALPPATVQRLLGGRAGRNAVERSRGIDPRPVVPRSLPASATVRSTFPRHTLDGTEVRTTLLDKVVCLALLLRRRHQVARGLTLTLKFAGGGRWDWAGDSPWPPATRAGEDTAPAEPARQVRRSAYMDPINEAHVSEPGTAPTSSGCCRWRSSGPGSRPCARPFPRPPGSRER